MEVCGIDIDFSKQSGYFIKADCLEGMKQFPDKFFDLAIVDPPYGDAKHIESSQSVQVERERATAKRLRIRGGTGSEAGSTSTNSRKNRWYMGE